MATLKMPAAAACALGAAQRAGKRIQVKHLAILALVVYGLSLLPVFLISRHNYASVDDFGYTAATHAVFAQGGSFFAVLAAAAREAAATWHSWQGSFAAIFLMALQPGIFANGAYALTAVIMVGALTAGVIMACRSVLGRLFGADAWSCLLTALFILFFAVHTLPSSVQGIFWYNGAVYYTFIFSLMLVMFSLLITFSLSARRGARAACLAGACLLAVFTGGGNYPTALCALLLFALMVLLLIMNKNGAWRWVLLPFAVHLGCFILSVAAPGNAVRQQGFAHQPSAVGAVLRALESVVVLAGNWLDPALAVALLALLPVLAAAARKSPLRFRLPVVVSLLCWGALGAGHAPTLYAMDNLGDDRVLNIQYFAFLLALVFNLFYWAGWLCRRAAAYKAGGVPLPKALLGWLRRWALPGMAGLLALFAAFTLSLKTYQGYTGYSALRSLLAGEAAQYGAEMRRRTALLEAPGDGEVTVPALTVRPRELFFADLSADPAYFSNRITAEYYGKQAVYLLVGTADTEA